METPGGLDDETHNPQKLYRLKKDDLGLYSTDADCDASNFTDNMMPPSTNDDLDDVEYLHRPSRGSNRKEADFMNTLDNHEEKATLDDRSICTIKFKGGKISATSKVLLSNLTHKIESQAKRKNPVNLGSLGGLKDATFAPRAISLTESSKVSHHHLIQNLPTLQDIHAARLQHGWSRML